MEKLLAAGADPNRVSADRDAKNEWTKQMTYNATPLETAIVTYTAEQKVKLLLRHGADPNRKGSRAGSMLIEALSVREGDADVLVKPLGDAGMPMNDPALLKIAMERNQPKLIEALLTHGADPNVSIFDAHSQKLLPLVSIASLRGDVELLKVLLAAGAVPDEGWRKSGYSGAKGEALRYLVERFRIPELIGSPDINLLVTSPGRVTTARIAEASADPNPPELVSWLLANGEKIQLPIVDESRAYQWSIMRKGEGGEPIRMKLDFSSDAPVPELRWGDLIVCESLSKTGNHVEFRTGLPDDLVGSLRERISFPIKVVIEGKTREITVKGSRVVFDPTKNEVPLLPVQQIAGLLWQPPLVDYMPEVGISVTRGGWPDIHFSYRSVEAGNFQLKAGDQVQLELSDGMRQGLVRYSRQLVSVRLEGYPFNRNLGAYMDGKSFEPSIPSLIQALVDIQLPQNSAWANLAGSSTLEPVVLASPELFFGRYSLFPHPDLSRIRILRTAGDGSEKRIEVDLTKSILAATDALTLQEARKSDTMLQAGDVVEIPVLEDKLDTPWKGYSPRENAFFAKALAGRLQVTDENGNITVSDINYRAPRFLETGGSWIPIPPDSGVPSARAWWQTRDRITEVQRGGNSFSQAAVAAIFLRNGDAIRLGVKPLVVPGPPRSSAPGLPPSR